MMNNLIKRLLFIVTIAVTTICPTFAEMISQAERNLLVKEDIASAQVLNEICPALISHPPQLSTLIGHFTVENLKRLSNPSMNFAQLQQDAEYQAAYQEAKKIVTAYDFEQKKTECDEALMSK